MSDYYGTAPEGQRIEYHDERANRWEVRVEYWKESQFPPVLPKEWEPFAVLPGPSGAVNVYLRRFR